MTDIIATIIGIYAFFGMALISRDVIEHLAESRETHDIALCVGATVMMALFWPYFLWERRA